MVKIFRFGGNYFALGEFVLYINHSGKYIEIDFNMKTPFSFSSLRICFSASVVHALRLLRLFPFSSCLLPSPLLLNCVSSGSVVSSFLLPTSLSFLGVSAAFVTLLQGCLPGCVHLCGLFLFGSTGFLFCYRKGGGEGGIVHSSVRIPGVYSLSDCA